MRTWKVVSAQLMAAKKKLGKTDNPCFCLQLWGQDCPGGPVAEILCFHCRGHMFDPCVPLSMVKKTAESEMCARESPPVGAAFAQKPFRIRRKSEL